MHELSIAASIVDIACEEAGRYGGRVEVVHLKLGALSGVVREALEFSWDLACDQTPVAGARLEIEAAAGSELQVTALEISDG
jgi:hydrogenase nickel incorporation protein HypA/HybF